MPSSQLVMDLLRNQNQRRRRGLFNSINNGIQQITSAVSQGLGISNNNNNNNNNNSLGKPDIQDSVGTLINSINKEPGAAIVSNVGDAVASVIAINSSGHHPKPPSTTSAERTTTTSTPTSSSVSLTSTTTTPVHTADQATQDPTASHSSSSSSSAEHPEPASIATPEPVLSIPTTSDHDQGTLQPMALANSDSDSDSESPTTMATSVSPTVAAAAAISSPKPTITSISEKPGIIPSPSPKSSLTAGQSALIAFGVLFGLGVIIVVCYFLCKQKRRRKDYRGHKKSASSTSSSSSSSSYLSASSPYQEKRKHVNNNLVTKILLLRDKSLAANLWQDMEANDKVDRTRPSTLPLPPPLPPPPPPPPVPPVPPAAVFFNDKEKTIAHLLPPPSTAADFSFSGPLDRWRATSGASAYSDPLSSPPSASTTAAQYTITPRGDADDGQVGTRTAWSRLSDLSSLSSGFGDGDILIPQQQTLALSSSLRKSIASTKSLQQSPRRARADSSSASTTTKSNDDDGDGDDDAEKGARNNRFSTTTTLTTASAGGLGRRDTVNTEASEDLPPRFRSVSSWVRQQTGRVTRERQRVDTAIKSGITAPVPSIPPEQEFRLMMPDTQMPRPVDETEQ